VITVSYNPPTPITAGNFYGHLLFGVAGPMVNTTIVGGKIRMLDRQLVGVDEKELAREARRLAASLWQKF
jgi:hypothetical protein